MRKIKIFYDITVSDDIPYIFFNKESDCNEPIRHYQGCDEFSYDSRDIDSIYQTLDKMEETFHKRAEVRNARYSTISINIDRIEVEREDGTSSIFAEGSDFETIVKSLDLINFMLN